MITRSMIFICILSLAACMQNAAGPRTAVAAPQQTAEVMTTAVAGQADARARHCEALIRTGRHKVGAGAAWSIAVSNDGGWCGRGLTFRGYAFTGGNVIDSPARGEARIRHLGMGSVIEYQASPGYTGDDSFSVTMIPGNAVYLVSVTVRSAT